ncbi:hypothetical protein G436_4774 [Leptospira interrogans serovar Hardjo str. Norma]|uniref:Uncharacterized protein n=1 Tax=Leptospira interrogans serovar Hardjo str. Norma TaxID=1279460 RepID=A0A0M4MYY1_LEPIR|nr:hypothetical protein G436_4774 [Leptospira interrogans serovar Hardjo str. Norma]
MTIKIHSPKSIIPRSFLDSLMTKVPVLYKITIAIPIRRFL